MLKAIKSYVKEKMSGETTGHDFFHVDRVRRNALEIASKEISAQTIDLFLVEAAALMHDLGDWKLNSTGRAEKEIIEAACSELDMPPVYTEKIVDIITHMSYSSNISMKYDLLIEGQIVQDSDRLEALGAIGLARTFAHGGKNKSEIYNPTIKPRIYKSTKEYRTLKNTSINHFYEKLFLLKDLMNTKTGKQMAERREKFMKDFLKEFYAEWNGEI